MTVRRYEGALTPLVRKPAAKKVVARKPPVQTTSRRFEGGGPLPRAPIKPRVGAPIRTPVAKKPAPAIRRRRAAPVAPPRLAGANDARHAPILRPRSRATLETRAAAAAGARRAGTGVAGNDKRKASTPGSPWARQQMFLPDVRLDASQVLDLRHAPPPPHARAKGRQLRRMAQYEAAMRAWRAKAAAVDRRRPATRVGKSRAI